MGVSSDLMYRLLVEGVVDYAIYMMDATGKVLNWNAGAQRAKGYRATEIVGQNYARFYCAEDRALGLPEANLAAAMRDGRLTTEGWRYRKDGSAFWASVVIDSIYGQDGAFLGFAKITRDLTEQHELMGRIKHQAAHDALTGIRNRGGFIAQLKDDLAKAAVAAVYYIDLDNFKPVNDRFGHLGGDLVLKEVARRLTVITRGIGHAGRLGGDEFAIARYHTHGPMALGEQIVSLLGQPIAMEDQTATIGASVGVAHVHGNGDIVGLLRNADAALYRAKASGKNCVRVHEGELPLQASA